MELYSDSASISGEHNKVHFEEFVGIGPRRFFDLFSLKLSSGRCIIRKDSSGKVCNWQRCDARLRCQLTGLSYLEKEGVESVKWNDYNDNKLKKGV